MRIKDALSGSELGRRLWMFRSEFLWVGAFSLIANVLMLTPTLYMLQLYDRVLFSGSELTLYAFTILLIGFFAVMAFAEHIRSRLLVRSSVKLDNALQKRVFTASFFSYIKRPGQKSTTLLGDMVTLRQFLTGNGIIAFFDIPWTPVYILVIFLLHPFLGLLSIVFAVIQLCVAVFSNTSSGKEIEDASESMGESYVYVQSKLRNIEPLHVMGMVNNMRDRWFLKHEQALKKAKLSFDKQSTQKSIATLIRYCLQSLTLGAGAIIVIRGEMSTGGMIAANVLMSRALYPLDIVVSTWAQFVQSRMSFLRLEKLLKDFPENDGLKKLETLHGNVRIDGLTASVEGREKPILDTLSADISAGSVVAVVGPSGSGKSTLARCIVGIWPQVEGSVELDGHAVGSLDRQSLGHAIGYLPQDVELFSGTIAENIARFGEIDPEKVVSAAKNTGVHEMILRFPKGYDTQLGHGGRGLSAGQRQRIALARAIYGNPSLLVLDEPNANLDSTGEQSLENTIRAFKKAGKTVFVVTHRQDILRVADSTIVLQDGRMVNAPALAS